MTKHIGHETCTTLSKSGMGEGGTISFRNS